MSSCKTRSNNRTYKSVQSETFLLKIIVSNVIKINDDSRMSSDKDPKNVSKT